MFPEKLGSPMGAVIAVLQTFSQWFCRHEWVRDRRPDGQYGQRCLRCMKQKQDQMALLISWRPEHRGGVGSR